MPGFIVKNAGILELSDPEMRAWGGRILQYPHAWHLRRLSPDLRLPWPLEWEFLGDGGQLFGYGFEIDMLATALAHAQETAKNR